MLKKMINSAKIKFDIIPIDPLLIKSGQATVGGVDMAFVRTYRSGDKEEPFIPGSSIKGMIRAYAEKICRSLRDDPVPVCLPYLDPNSKPLKGEERQDACGLRFEKLKKDKKLENIPSQDVYRLSCPVCRLFGSHGFAGRLATADGYLSEQFKGQGKALFEIRDGVAIDRLTGGTAGGAKYDLEVLTRGEFSTTLDIRNFELYQLGLIALVLRDLEAGLVRIGFGKSRGLGRFKAKVTCFTVSFYHRNPKNLAGLCTLCTQEENNRYGFFSETAADGFPLSPTKPIGLRYEHDITQTWKTALEPTVSNLVGVIEKVNWPADLETYVKRGGHVDS